MPHNSDLDTTVYAAGAVLWRIDPQGKVRVLTIHRERHGDVSLPKGKVDEGETLPETAVREVREETGYEIALQAPLGFIEYTLPNGRSKEVHYWTYRVTEEHFQRHDFAPNDEVDRLEWLSLKKASARLSYERDRELLGVLRARIERGTAETFAVIALRHAKAVPPLSWPGDDDTRPLTARGQEQAEEVVPIISAFAPERIVTSSAVRCRATVAPLAAATGLTPVSAEALSQGARPGTGSVDEIVAQIVEEREPTVICSHSPVMPAIVARLAAETGTRLGGLSRQAMLSTAECSVIHIPISDPRLGIVAAETHGPII